MRRRILVTPLDWGLGHATRCIPVIRELINQQCEVMIAGSGVSLELLKHEFPSFLFFELPAYNPEYPSKGSMAWKMVRQLPHFISVIEQEHKVVDGLIKKFNIDRIISDNRYGCWSDKVASVLITHQSNLMMPRRFGWLSPIVRNLLHKKIKKFQRCWIPDHPGGKLSGLLSSYGKLADDITVEHIGMLSRFQRSAESVKKFDIAAIFSGPEPQRTIFEKIVWSQLKESQFSFFVVRGLPSGKTAAINNNNSADYMTSESLKEVMEGSEIIIARSGYSTIMDLAGLGKKAILVPTPGQTEQEYLATQLKKNKIAYTVSQKDFNLKLAIAESHVYSGFGNETLIDDYLKKAIRNLLA